MTTISLWTATGGAAPSAVAASGPCRLSPEGVDTAADLERRDGRAPLVVPMPTPHGGIALLLVPDELSAALTRNGRRLEAGAHVLEHADGLAWGDLRVWLARADSATETTYDPEVHGHDMACARTRSRLQPGEAVVVCPGTETNECGVLYRAAAWLGMRCHLCGFDPRGAAWSPPQKDEGELNDLLRLAVENRDQ